jgi:RHS repeat-associated protein
MAHTSFPNFLDYRLTSLNLKNGTTVVSGMTYAYGDQMNLTGITDQVTAANSNTLSYSATNRLASASGAWGSAAYSYDPVGNRLSDVVTGALNKNRQSSIDSFSNRITGMTENAAAFRTYSYDGAGNIATDVRPGETYGYTYNKRNRLASVTRNAVVYATYVYNAFEQLTSRVTTAAGAPAGTVHYIYDLDGHLIVEADAATGATLREYIWLPSNDNHINAAGGTVGQSLGLGTLAANDNNSPDLPLAIVDTVNTTPTLLMVHSDHLGRPIRLTDSTKATVWQATYKPWGETQSISGTRTNNLRFPGQYFQIETNLAYNHHRHYDPVTGRYTQPDPLRFVDGPAIYAYAGSSPWMKVDRSGLDIAIVVGATTGNWSGDSGQSCRCVANPFGHVGIGITGLGAFSPGTDSAPGSSFDQYLEKQSQYRSSTIFKLKTPKEVDQCVAKALSGQTTGLPGASLEDNCATRISDALKKCGIDISTLNLPGQFVPWAMGKGIPYTDAPKGQSTPGFSEFNPK